MRDDKIIHVYEYYEQAGARGINGMPIFMSMKEINEDDWKKIVKFIEEYKIKLNSFLDKKEVEAKQNDGPMLF